MTYNNLETQVTSVSGTWNGTAISFSTLGLSTSIPFKDQIEVERIFSSSAFTAVKDNITTTDLHKIFLLAKTEYTITGNTISAFSMNGTRSYTLTGGSSSGTAIPIPAISNGDSVIIRRKTLSMDTYVTWAPGTKLTTTQLNQQVGQLLRLNQELIYKLDTEYVRAADLSGSVAPVLAVNNNLNMNSYQILNLATPASAVGSDTGAGVNKGYVDTNFVNKSTAQTGIAGAKTFTGAITLSSTLAVTGAVTLSSGLTVDTNTLVVDATNDRVGIGIANPSTKLHVSGASSTLEQIYLANSSSTSYFASMVAGSTGVPGSGVPANSVWLEGVPASSGNTYLSSYYNNLAFATGSSRAERMRIENNGNLILGNVNAAGDIGRALDIYNHATGASAASLIRLITHDAGTIPAPSSIGQIVKYQTGGFVMQNTDINAAAHIRFDVGSSERMRISSSGALIHGATTTGSVGAVSLVPGGSSPFINKLVFGTDDSGYKFAIASQNGANAAVNRLVICDAQNAGNVGIGTDSPLTKLQINVPSTGTTLTGTSRYGGIHLSQNNTNDEFVGITAAINNNGTQGGILFQSSGGYGTKMRFLTTDNFGTGMQIRMTLDHSGNFGIGTTNPSTKLAVNGTTSISGVTTLSSTEGSTNTTSGALQVGGGVGIAGALHVGNTINAGSTIATTSSIQTMTGSAPAAGGVNCITLTSSNIAIIVASASPNGVITAPKGSLCINTGASAGSTRLWINTNSSTTWAAVTSG
jgi:hypothetical protein